jgi:hypothetical protein
MNPRLDLAEGAHGTSSWNCDALRLSDDVMHACAKTALIGAIVSATALAAAAATAGSNSAMTVERSDCPPAREQWSQKALLPIVKGVGFEGVVLPAKAAKAVLCQCNRESLGLASGYWTPTSSELSQLEARLPDYLRAHRHTARPDQWRNLGAYLRQYLGIERADRRLIYVNVLGGALFSPARRVSHRRAIEHVWRSTAFVICDGGPDFFGAEYDVASQRFTRIDFNL